MPSSPAVAQNSVMAKPAGKLAPHPGADPTWYEQPLSERMRTFLRLEFLYQQMLYNAEQDADWGTRATITTLLDIMAILARGDVRSDVHKELDAQLGALQRFQAQPDVDSGRLDALIQNLLDSRLQVADIGTQFLQPLKDSEFLSAIKHRSAIPGGTCEFDLPVYSHWLRQPFARRQEDIDGWIAAIRPLCDAALEVLWLIRESARPTDRVPPSMVCTSIRCRRTCTASCCACARSTSAGCFRKSAAASIGSPCAFSNGRASIDARCRPVRTSASSWPSAESGPGCLQRIDDGSVGRQ